MTLFKRPFLTIFAVSSKHPNPDNIHSPENEGKPVFRPPPPKSLSP